MYCSEKVCGNESEINPDDDETDDDVIQDPLAFVAVNYDEDASREGSFKNEKVILHDYGEDGGDPSDGLVYDPEVLGYDALSTHMGNPFNSFHPYAFQISSAVSRYEKPPYSFSSLIAMAIENSDHKYLTVPEICQYISSRFPYYDIEDDSWKCHVRYTLSTQKCFVSTTNNSPFEGGLWPGSSNPYWTIDRDYKARTKQGQRWNSDSFSTDGSSGGENNHSHDIFRLRKPPYSYTTLIAMAIEASEGKMATLSDIYKYISSRFPYYNSGLKLWQNSIRHFLSVTKYFVKVPKENAGRGHYWTIGVPSSERNVETFQNQFVEAVDGEVSDNCDDSVIKSNIEPEVIVVEPEVTITPLDGDLPSPPSTLNSRSQPPSASAPIEKVPQTVYLSHHPPNSSLMSVPNHPSNAFILKDALSNTVFLKQSASSVPIVMRKLMPKANAVSFQHPDSSDPPSTMAGYSSLKAAATFIRIAPKPPKKLPELLKQDTNHPFSPVVTYSKSEMKIDYKKPPFAFTTLISMAIENSPKGMATLGQIYEFISTRFPYFDMENKGWQNTVRHFLSVTNYFVKIPREGFKGNFWTIEKSKKKSKVHKIKIGMVNKKGKGKGYITRKNAKKEYVCSLCTFSSDDKEDFDEHMLSIHGVVQSNSESYKNKTDMLNSKSPDDDSESTESCKEFPDSPSSQNGDSDHDKIAMCQPAPNLSCQDCTIEHDNLARSHLVTSSNKNAALTC